MSRFLPFILAGSALALAFLLFVLSRGPSASKTPSPVLGEHLHSLLAFGTGPSLLVGTHGASAISPDGGKSLRIVDGLNGLDAMESAASSSGTTLFVAGHNGAMVSVNGGRTWQPYGTTLPTTDIHALAVDGRNVRHVVAYAVGNGIFETADGGHTWRQTANPPVEPMGTGIINGSTIVLPTMGAGLLKSSDNGATWTVFARSVGGMTLATDPGAPSHLFLSGAGPLFVSTDAGATWQQKAVPASAQVVVSGGHGALYAAGYSGDNHALTWSSADDGATWIAESKG